MTLDILDELIRHFEALTAIKELLRRLPDPSAILEDLHKERAIIVKKIESITPTNSAHSDLDPRAN